MGPRTRKSDSLAGPSGLESETDFDSANVICTVEKKTIPAKRLRGRPPSRVNKVIKPAARGTRQRIAKGEKSLARSASDILEEKSNASSTKSAEVVQEVPSEGSAMDMECGGLLGQNGSGGPANTTVSRGRPKRSRTCKAEDANIIVEHLASTAIQEIPETQQSGFVEIDEGEQQCIASYYMPDDEVENAEGILYHEMGGAVRLRLSELTKKYESLESRHRDLREVGVKVAESNFERLKKQVEENVHSEDPCFLAFEVEIGPADLTKFVPQVQTS